jgi:hypothetical protein
MHAAVGISVGPINSGDGCGPGITSNPWLQLQDDDWAGEEILCLGLEFQNADQMIIQYEGLN